MKHRPFLSGQGVLDVPEGVAEYGGERRRIPGAEPVPAGDEATGAQIVKIALDAPLRQIAVKAGLEGGVVVERVRGLAPNHGLDAATGQYVDLLSAGIIDPAKVTRSALRNAASIAALFLTTEAVVADRPEKEKTPAAGGDMGGVDF
jgi:chaperonin GroEL